MQRCTAEQRVPTTCTVDGGYIGMKLALHPSSFKDTPSYPIQSNHISRLLSDLKKKKKKKHAILNILSLRVTRH